MSVRVDERNESHLAYYYDAIKMRKAITKLLLRDFGVKDKVRSINFGVKLMNMEEEDEATFIELMNKYNVDNRIVEEFPSWLIDTFRKAIMDNLIKLTKVITLADAIPARTQAELEEKFVYQDNAVGFCKNLLQDLQYAMDVFPINVEKLMPYVDMIEKEIENIHRWKDRTEKEYIRKQNIKEAKLTENESV